MKSKDDKSEDGSDQERECLEYDCHSLFPPARSVHVLAHIYCVLRVFSRRMYSPILISCDLTAELRSFFLTLKTRAAVFAIDGFNFY